MRRVLFGLTAVVSLVAAGLVFGSTRTPEQPSRASLSVRTACADEMVGLAGAVQMYILDRNLNEKQLLSLISQPMSALQAKLVKENYLEKPTTCSVRFNISVPLAKRGAVDVRIECPNHPGTPSTAASGSVQ